MSTTIILSVIGAVAGVVVVFGKWAFDRFVKTTQNAAVNRVTAEIAKKEAEDVRTAAEELVKHVETSDTVKTLKDGKF